LILSLSFFLFYFSALMEISNQNPTLLLDGKLIVVKVGDSLTLTCFYNNAKIYFLYKQTLDQRLHLISSAYKQGQFFSFNGDFKENPRFRQEITERDNQIKISPVQLSDTATYFCAHGELGKVTFEKGTRVRVKGSTLDVKVSADGSASQSLNCTVFTGGCWDQLSVKESKIPHENRTPQCLRIPRSNHHTCLYNEMIKGKDHINAGFNFCAIASCGHELFRNTTVFIGEGEKLLSSVDHSLKMVHILGGALAFNIILILLLAFVLYTLYKKSQRTALNVIQVSKTGRKRNITKTACVYSTVKN
uniref:Immunoglobulin domain-containing protein n=1 Tax=Gouania willdenowi TaxID=441366 RepID=A0A8C5HLP4_GOUWI